MVRDKDLSVISSLSILESTQQKSSPDVGSEGCTQISPPPSSSPPQEGKGAEASASSGNDHSPLAHVQQQTTPTSHMGTHSIHMTLEDHQNQLQTLQDEVR